MAFTGYLAEFSLPEIFQFLERGHKTGLLTVKNQPGDLIQESQIHYTWLHQGRIVAASDSLDGRGLVSMIDQRGWASDRVASKVGQICPVNTPIGLCLKSHGLLQAEQLKLLFRTQVVGQVSSLFELKDGKFEFDAKAALPSGEMTGLSMPATEATLLGLRTLRDWTALTEKLPEPTSGLSSTVNGQPQFKLDSQEWQVWEFANGTVSLQAIAKQLGLPVAKVQQIAFRLIVVNLAEESFMLGSEPITAAIGDITPAKVELAEPKLNLPEPAMQSSGKANVSQSFLQNLVGFLKGKV